MVEMVETAAILNQATPQSLVILDEVGRGTATFDGLSIAWACVEYLHEMNACRALFATHYHELTALAHKLENLANVTMKVREWKGDVVFLHEVIAGVADRSYGIQVAKLAGLPDEVIGRAGEVLSHLVEDRAARGPTSMVDDLPLFSASAKEQALPLEPSQVEAAVEAMHPDEFTPRQALEFLYKLRSLLRRT
jgi:DNA mismatch repair protein MutS